MPPRRFKKKSVKRIVEKRVAKAIEEIWSKRQEDDSKQCCCWIGSAQLLEGLLHQRCMDVRIRHLRTANLTLSTGLKAHHQPVSTRSPVAGCGTSPTNKCDHALVVSGSSWALQE
ncbi:hypothetical protein Tco_0439250 [Tanacetum coccineum]